METVGGDFAAKNTQDAARGTRRSKRLRIAETKVPDTLELPWSRMFGSVIRQDIALTFDFEDVFRGEMSNFLLSSDEDVEMTDNRFSVRYPLWFGQAQTSYAGGTIDGETFIAVFTSEDLAENFAKKAKIGMSILTINDGFDFLLNLGQWRSAGFTSVHFDHSGGTLVVPSFLFRIDDLIRQTKEQLTP